MNKELSYKDYINDEEHMNKYIEYQKKYATKIRESDKVIINIIKDLIRNKVNREEKLSLLDIGCSTGNLLFHIKNNIPQIKLFGCDLASNIINECKNNSQLYGINFEVKDLLELGYGKKFDIIIANVIFFVLNNDELTKAILNISKALKDNGWLIAFDLFHQFEQEISIIEKTKFHPEGLPIYIRSYSLLKESLEKAQLINIDLRPFNISIDLEKPRDLSDITSYTIKTSEESRMCFRGTLFQPWCHVIAQKKG